MREHTTYQHPKSMQKTILVFILGAILPLSLLLIISNIYTTRLYYNTSKDSFENILEHQSSTLSSSLDTISSLIITQHAGSVEIRQMQTAADYETLYHNSYSFINSLAPYMETLPYHYAIFTYKSDSGFYKADISDSLTQEEKFTISDTLKELSLSDEALPLGKWHILVKDEQPLLTFSIGSKDVYTGIFLFTEPFLTDNSDLTSSTCLLYDGNLYVSADSVYEQVSPDHPGNTEHLLFKKQIDKTGLQMLALLPKTAIYADMHIQYKVLLVLSLLSAGIIPLTIFFLQKFMFRPLKKLKHMIQLIQTDIPNVQIPHSPFREMEEIYGVFEHFIDRISTLKIQSYEERLVQQQYHLQYLQLQLKPHFYLNSLKFLYSLAIRRDVDTIKSFLICLSEYFEYIVYHADSLVTIEEELKHTQLSENAAAQAKQYDLLYSGCRQFPDV